MVSHGLHLLEDLAADVAHGRIERVLLLVGATAHVGALVDQQVVLLGEGALAVAALVDLRARARLPPRHRPRLRVQRVHREHLWRKLGCPSFGCTRNRSTFCNGGSCNLVVLECDNLELITIGLGEGELGR